MTALQLIEGGGEHSVTQQCRVCGVAHHGGCAVLARHIEHLALRGLAVKTRENRVSQIRLAAAALPVPLLDAGKADLRAWRAGLRREPGGILNSVSHLNQFFLWALREGLMDANPADGLPVPRRPRRMPRPISQRDLFTALAAAAPPLRAWLVLGAYADLRCVEIAGLKAGSVRLDDEPPVLIVTAESVETTALYAKYDSPQARKAVESIPLPDAESR